MSTSPVPIDVVTHVTSSCPTATHVLAELPYRPSAVPKARRVLRECVGLAHLPDEVRGIAELLVSELVTNAVKYGKPPVWLLVELRPGLVHASVSDTSTLLPRRREADPDAEGGRGLLVLDALAGSWGAMQVDYGKYLWFDLPFDPSGTGSTEQVGVRELKQNPGRVLATVKLGETVEVTERGTPVARLMPTRQRSEYERLREAGEILLGSQRVLDVQAVVAPGLSLSGEIAAMCDEDWC